MKNIEENKKDSIINDRRGNAYAEIENDSALLRENIPKYFP